MPADRWQGDVWPTGRPAPRPGRVAKVVTAAVLGLVVVLIGVRVAAGVWTSHLWFQSLGYESVWRTRNLTQLGLFAAGFVIVAGLVGFSLRHAYRTRPFRIPLDDDDMAMERYRSALAPMRKALWIVTPLVFGVFGGATAAGQWRTALLWWNRSSFGQRDPHLHHDIGYYVFVVPWLRFLLSFATMALVLSLLAALVAHYLYGGISLRANRHPETGAASPGTTAACTVHLVTLAVVLLLVRAGSYWLSRDEATSASMPSIVGITSSAQHTLLPARAVLALAAVCCALMFVSTVVTGSWRVPIIGAVMLTVLAVVIGQVYPAFVAHREDSSAAKEASYVRQAMTATAEAYGFSGMQRSTYPTGNAGLGTREQVTRATQDVGVADPEVAQPTLVQQLDAQRPQVLPNDLDADRYVVDGRSRDVISGVNRVEAADVPANRDNWIGRHLVYTHGYGMVVADASRTASDGAVDFLEKGDGSRGALGHYERRIYFGPGMQGYAIAGSTAMAEHDTADSSRTTRYTGGGGVSLDSTLTRMAYALRDGDRDIWLSPSVTKGSRMIDGRDPAERVRAAAPWLTTDSSVYASIVDGRVVWIVDGYTTTSAYPGAAKSWLGSGSLQTSGARAAQGVQGREVNYVRNAVKATVDAYTGTVTLYAWDETDPILRTWRKAFPDTVKPKSELSASLRAHLRYPRDLFSAQRAVLGQYHERDVAAFLDGSTTWHTPTTPVTPDVPTEERPAFYGTLEMPGRRGAASTLTSPLLNSGQGMAAYLGVDSDATASTYGTLRLLEVPRGASLPGPNGFDRRIEASSRKKAGGDQTLSSFLAQRRPSGGYRERGAVKAVPAGGGYLYVEPVYDEGGSLPSARQSAVILGYGERVAWGDTFETALADLFAADQPGVSGASGDKAALQEALSEAKAAQKAADDAVAAKDWDAYRAAQKKLGEALDDATKASGATASPTPTSTPSSSTPTATASPSSASPSASSTAAVSGQ